MRNRKLWLSAFGLSLVLTAAALLNQPAAAAKKSLRSLTGSWRITVDVQGVTTRALATATSDGTVIQTAGLPGVSTGHGVWKRTGKNEFEITSTYFRLDENGQVIGTSVTVTEVALTTNNGVVTAVGSYQNTLLDLNGNQVGQFGGTTTATRM